MPSRRLLFAFLFVGVVPVLGQARHVAAQDAAPPAIRSNVDGFLLGAYGSFVALRADGTLEHGWGGSFRAGYGLFSTVVLYAQVDAARVDNRGALPAPEDLNPSYGLGHFDLGLQLHLASRQAAIVPYVDAAFSGRSALLDSGESDLLVSGLATTLGGGIKLYVHPNVAFDAGGRYAFGTFSRAEADGAAETLDLDAATLRFFAGLSLYPFR